MDMFVLQRPIKFEEEKETWVENKSRRNAA